MAGQSPPSISTPNGPCRRVSSVSFSRRASPRRTSRNAPPGAREVVSSGAATARPPSDSPWPSIPHEARRSKQLNTRPIGRNGAEPFLGHCLADNLSANARCQQGLRERSEAVGDRPRDSAATFDSFARNAESAPSSQQPGANSAQSSTLGHDLVSCFNCKNVRAVAVITRQTIPMTLRCPREPAMDASFQRTRTMSVESHDSACPRLGPHILTFRHKHNPGFNSSKPSARPHSEWKWTVSNGSRLSRNTPPFYKTDALRPPSHPTVLASLAATSGARGGVRTDDNYGRPKAISQLRHTGSMLKAFL
jgi:hypothetical protein